MRDLSAVDWNVWRPKERCTLCFLFEGNKILLIHKKTNLGAGLINGPGGKIESGETPAQGAIRETYEETRMVPINPQWVGTMNFAFDSGYDLQVEVFRTDVFSGEMQETEEAKPFWCDIDKIPFDSMWPDDRHWFPHLLEGKPFICLAKFTNGQLFEPPIVLSRG